MAGAGLLQPSQKLAHGSATGRSSGWIPTDTGGHQGVERGRRLHGSGHRLDSVWNTCCGGGWKCVSRAGTPLWHQYPHQYDRGKEGVCPAGSGTVAYRRAIGLQPGDDGLWSDTMYTQVASMWRLPADGIVCGVTRGQGRRVACEVAHAEGEGAQTDIRLHQVSGRNGHSSSWRGRHLAGTV